MLAPPHTVPKTSSGKIRRVAAREYYERGPSAVKPQAVWLQFVRLALAGVGAAAAPRLARRRSGLLFAARAWLAVRAAVPGRRSSSPRCVPGMPTWKMAGTLRAPASSGSAGIPLVVRGLENLPASGPFVLAANHTSYLDGAVLLAVAASWRNYAFVAKRELADNFSRACCVTGLGAAFVERFDVQKSAEHADELAAAAKRGVSLIVFPEGTLMRHTGLMPFRTGAFQAAAQAGVPVVPVALRGVRSVLRDGTWYLRRAPIAVTFGAPILPEGDDWNAARAAARRRCAPRSSSTAASPTSPKKGSGPFSVGRSVRRKRFLTPYAIRIVPSTQVTELPPRWMASGSTRM